MDYNITSKTGLFGLIGNPVDHSLSPIIHNYLFNEYKLENIYLPFNTSKSELGEAIKGFKALGGRGLNITAPFKEKALNYVDEISGEAELIGAINTIKNESGILYGYNTDFYGIVNSFRFAQISVAGKKVLVFGSGGTAKTMCAALNFMGASELIILNRKIDKAKELSEVLGEKRILSIYGELNVKNIIKEIKNADIIVNATSVDVFANYSINLDSPCIKDIDVAFYDVIYNPFYTKMLLEARKNGLRTVNGISMLIFQAMKAFEIWTGVCTKTINYDILFTMLTQK